MEFKWYHYLIFAVLLLSVFVFVVTNTRLANAWYGFSNDLGFSSPAAYYATGSYLPSSQQAYYQDDYQYYPYRDASFGFGGLQRCRFVYVDYVGVVPVNCAPPPAPVNVSPVPTVAYGVQPGYVQNTVTAPVTAYEQSRTYTNPGRYCPLGYVANSNANANASANMQWIYSSQRTVPQ